MATPANGAVLTPNPSIPTPEQAQAAIIPLAQRGQTRIIKEILERRPEDANFKDKDGVSVLHWAAWNNHYELCELLISKGADVDATGGEQGATPVLWASRRCHIYIVDLLLRHNASAEKPDDQGFNLLHSATMEGNDKQLLTILRRYKEVDRQDSTGHTAVMWAAYKGFPACVEALLKYGASVHIKDMNGFTALHWALVKGSELCIRKLIENGADRQALTNEGKSPTTVAKEMNSTHVWHRALQNAGYDVNGQKIPPLQLPSMIKSRKRFMDYVMFCAPILVLYIDFHLIAAYPIWLGFPLAFGVYYGLHAGATWLVTHAELPRVKTVTDTPFLSAIFFGSVACTVIHYLAVVLPSTWSNFPLQNIFMLASISGSCYYFFKAMAMDPGYVPKSQGLGQSEEQMEELLRLRKFDDRNFCIPCMSRKPLRSKHCRNCGRCVAKHDHHCPWVYNCVGANNHRAFIFFVVLLLFAIISNDYLSYAYLKNYAPAGSDECLVLDKVWCERINRDYYAVILYIWMNLQGIWVVMLATAQLFQIARAQTTYEVMRGRNHDLSKPAAAGLATIAAGATSFEAAGLEEAGGGPQPGATDSGTTHAAPKRETGWFAEWKRLLGVDVFIATAIHGSRADEVLAQRARNPFNKGMWQNMVDFFSRPARGETESGYALLDGRPVNYTSMYEVPSERVAYGGNEYAAVGDEDRGD